MAGAFRQEDVIRPSKDPKVGETPDALVYDLTANDTEGAILERTLTKCLNDRAIALKYLADSDRLVDKAAFGHQVYLRDKLNLDQAANCVAHV